jgi:hypothetical protein
MVPGLGDLPCQSSHLPPFPSFAKKKEKAPMKMAQKTMIVTIALGFIFLPPYSFASLVLNAWNRKLSPNVTTSVIHTKAAAHLG